MLRDRGQVQELEQLCSTSWGPWLLMGATRSSQSLVGLLWPSLPQGECRKSRRTQSAGGIGRGGCLQHAAANRRVRSWR